MEDLGNILQEILSSSYHPPSRNGSSEVSSSSREAQAPGRRNRERDGLRVVVESNAPLAREGDHIVERLRILEHLRLFARRMHTYMLVESDSERTCGKL